MFGAKYRDNIFLISKSYFEVVGQWWPLLQWYFTATIWNWNLND